MPGFGNPDMTAGAFRRTLVDFMAAQTTHIHIETVHRGLEVDIIAFFGALQRVALDPKHPHWLASEAEMLALMPELKPPG